MGRTQFYSGISLVLAFSCFGPVFAQNGPSGDSGLMDTREMRSAISAGGTITSQSNVISGGSQVRFNGDTSPIRNNADQVNKALSQQGFYQSQGKFQNQGTIVSGGAIHSAARYSGADQLGQNPAVVSVAGIGPTLASDHGLGRGASVAMTASTNAVKGLVNNPAGVTSHAQQLSNYEVKTGSRPTNSFVGYTVPPAATVTAAPAAVTVQPTPPAASPAVTYPPSQAEMQYGVDLR